MTNELNKSLAFVGVAVALMGTAVLATWPRDRAAEAFSDQGQPFFPEFKDPLAATSLEIDEFDPATGEPVPFQVTLKDGKWVIPSHHDYPADAKDRLAKTAAGVIDLKKDVIVSDRPDQFEELGVVDPLDRQSPSIKGRGKRVTLKNKSGEVLADLIIGKEVPGRQGQRYVRVPDRSQRRTYAVNVDVDLSTKFADWIETNLLKIDTGKVRKVTFDSQKIDPDRGDVVPGATLTIEKPSSTGNWTTEGLGPDQELDSTKLSDLTSALGDLKIVGVRTKPADLVKVLEAFNKREPVSSSAVVQAARSLMSRGFFLLRDGRLLSTNGEVTASTEEGVVYDLRFGDVTYATGEALTAGIEDSAATKEAEGKEKDKDKEKKPEGGVESRYLFVTARFDPALIPVPESLRPSPPSELPEDAFQRTAAERADRDKSRKEKADRDKADYDRKVADGKKKAEDLANRFARWYYVVPGDAFRSIALNRETLVRPKQDKPASSPSFPPPATPFH
jgi:hypothetical protein